MNLGLRSDKQYVFPFEALTQEGWPVALAEDGRLEYAEVLCLSRIIDSLEPPS